MQEIRDVPYRKTVKKKNPNERPLIANEWLAHREKYAHTHTKCLRGKKRERIVNLSLSLSRFFASHLVFVLCNERCAQWNHRNTWRTSSLFFFAPSVGAYLYPPTFVSISHNKQLSALARWWRSREQKINSLPKAEAWIHGNRVNGLKKKSLWAPWQASFCIW